jgi:hypothetical protein
VRVYKIRLAALKTLVKAGAWGGRRAAARSPTGQRRPHQDGQEQPGLGAETTQIPVQHSSQDDGQIRWPTGPPESWRAAWLCAERRGAKASMRQPPPF